ncbi:MAG: serine/threonine protein kinase [Myxococcales bacterium]|nr:serine/threonine protein kinase [Myxococcales bacterium]
MESDPALQRTILRHPSSAGATDEGVADPILESGSRRRVAAFAGLTTVGFVVGFLMDVAMHAGFGGGALDPERFKNLAMGGATGLVYWSAARSQASMRTVTALAYAMVLLIASFTALDALRFFQWPEAWPDTREYGHRGTHTSVVEGLSWPCLLLLVFPPFVPGRPRHKVWLAVASVAPLLVASWSWSVVDPRSFWLILSPTTFANLPICVALSAAISWSIDRVESALRRERKRSRELGSYEMVRRLGRGGMGEVWLARHKMLARPAALKLIKVDDADGSSARPERLMRRFEREARATAQLRSAHTVELYDFGRTEDGDFYYAMELLDGLDLAELVERDGPQPPARVAYILAQACLSLQEAHARGLVHRDIKPANIFLCRLGAELDVVKVLDFGLVASTARKEGATLDEGIVGTPAFMAPEMVLGVDAVDGEADIYALGCVGYWLLTGAWVFVRDTAVATCMAHVHDTPPPLSERGARALPASLERAIMAALAKDPKARPDAPALREQLREVADAWSEADRRDRWREPAD